MFSFAKKIEYLELQKFIGKFWTLYMYGMSGFAEKLNVQNCINSTENCVHCMYEISGFAEKLNIENCENSMGNCVHYMYGMSGFADKLTI